MSWDDTYSHDFLIAFDYWCCAVFFGVLCMTVSTLSGLVRDGRDGPFRLHPVQKDFLKWLAPKLSKAHTDRARSADYFRANRIVNATRPRIISGSIPGSGTAAD